jgi:K(+)-stimulated pyrophosphate-energized sodium pump
MLTTIGVGLAVAFNPLTSYFTSTKSAPVKEVVESTRIGPATTILSGLSVGMESSVWALVVIAISFIFSLFLYGNMEPIYVLYGVAMVGIGMLSHTGNNVAMDSYGPISDNANGIGEMAWHDQTDEETKRARQIMADLDAVGNTTKAITKGVAIASAVIAAVSLFSSYITDVSRVQIGLINELGMDIEVLDSIRVSDIKVFVGLLLGGALPWLFSSLSIRAVTRAAGKVVEEVRRQFKLPGIMEGTKKPDYAQVVGISTASAQKELIPLAIIAVVMPLLIGLVLQVEALGGFQVGVILSGQLLAVFMANTGGAWDNAKKMIEDEPRNLIENTGKGSERHKAGVVGDTVGDPLKDTAGPALNPMIKVVNLVSLIAAPVIVRYQELGAVGWVVVAILLGSVTWAIMQSKKSVTI